MILPVNNEQERVKKLMDTFPNAIFVFGSNRAGIHGAGAALHAVMHYGACQGQGEGLQGRSYALPTKDVRIETLPLEEIKKHVDKFIEFAQEHPELDFILTKVGTGLAGYTDGDMAPLFYEAPHNVRVCPEWSLILLEHLWPSYTCTVCKTPLSVKTMLIEDEHGKFSPYGNMYCEEHAPSMSLGI